jgi:class 3 adenylate cyclase
MTDTIGQRQLAAIVFTDVAGFSSKTEADEEKTLRRVKEDLKLLTSLSAAHNGKVVKTTGDGLLISFGSAIDAVSFALEAQGKISARNETLSAIERLEHRMGIHLGDIFISESDAMGDGVNIAARLQSEAEPGGICISQTVYDVVKNKLAIRAVAIGPRELKNIREAIYAYRIVLDAESTLARQAPAAARAHASKRRFSPSLVVTVVLCALALFIVIRGRHRRLATTPPQAPPASSAALRASLPEDPRLARIAWVKQRLVQRGPDNPLTIIAPRRTGDGFGGKEFTVWMEGEDILIKSDGEIIQRQLEQLAPRMLAAIALGIAREDRAGTRMKPPAPARRPAPPRSQ